MKLRCCARQLTDADRAELRANYPNIRKSRSQEIFALIEGLVADFKLVYMPRWAMKTGRPAGTFVHDRSSEECFREAAIRCFELDIPIQRYLACAEESCRSVKYPTPNHLKGGYILRVIKDWIPPAERKNDAGETPILHSDFTGTFQRPAFAIPFNRNWPGLFGVPATAE